MNFPPPFLETNGLFGFLSRRLSHFLFDVKLLKKIFSVEEELFLNENFEVDLATWQRFCSHTFRFSCARLVQLESVAARGLGSFIVKI